MKKRRISLGIYRPECLKCSHLVELGNKTYDKCHYTKGNTHCPASEVKIVVIGQALLYAGKVKLARDARDSEKEAALMNAVASKSKAFQSKFYEALEKGYS